MRSESSLLFDNKFELGNNLLANQLKLDAYQLLELPYAWGGFGLFVATGIRT